MTKIKNSKGIKITTDRKIIIMITVMFLFALLSLMNREKTIVVPLRPTQIGWSQELAPTVAGQRFVHYSVMTPRGLEEVVGYKNLSNSLDAYIMNDVYGIEVESLNDKQKKRFRVK